MTFIVASFELRLSVVLLLCLYKIHHSLIICNKIALQSICQRFSESTINDSILANEFSCNLCHFRFLFCVWCEYGNGAPCAVGHYNDACVVAVLCVIYIAVASASFVDERCPLCSNGWQTFRAGRAVGHSLPHKLQILICILVLIQSCEESSQSTRCSTVLQG